MNEQTMLVRFGQKPQARFWECVELKAMLQGTMARRASGEVAALTRFGRVFAVTFPLIAGCGGASSQTDSPGTETGGFGSAATLPNSVGGATAEAGGTVGSGGTQTTTATATGGIPSGVAGTPTGRGGGPSGTAGTATGRGGAGVGVTAGAPSGLGGSPGITGGASSAGAGTAPAIVTNGASCSPVGARACTNESTVAQMVCSAGNVWQWSADCPTGQVCNPRPGLKVGTCVAPDRVCKGVTGPICSSDWTIPAAIESSCSSGGVQLSSQRCRSDACDSDAKHCSPVVCYSGTMGSDIEVDCKPDCSPGSCAVPGQLPTTGVTFTDSVFETFQRMLPVDDAMGYSLPAAAQLPSVAECPEIRAFLIYPTTSIELAVVLLPEYWAIKVPLAGLPGTYKSVVALACTATAHLTGTVIFNPAATPGEALLIATSDATAAPFNIKVY